MNYLFLLKNFKGKDKLAEEEKLKQEKHREEEKIKNDIWDGLKKTYLVNFGSNIYLLYT